MRLFTRYLDSAASFAPDDEGGADVLETNLDTGGGDGDSGSDDGGGADDGPGGEGTPQEKLSVREQLKRSIAEVNADDAGKGEKPKRGKDGRFGDRTKPAAEAKPPVDSNAPVVPAASATPAPAALSAEAKAEWDKTPPAVQAAFVKREQDMQAGVQQLQQKYQLIDQAIAPHTDALRQMNATPQEAVHRMFLWFKALAGTPQVAFPELAKSMGIDWTKLITPRGAPQPQAQPQLDANGQPIPPQPGAPEIPDAIKTYIGGLEQKLMQMGQQLGQVAGRFGSVEQNINTQNQARTEENLNFWSKDKPHFQAVRQDMARLIESGVVPLKEGGQVDLDTAYERAIYFNPEVRAKVLAEQQQANLDAQKEAAKAATAASQVQVGKARKAAGGVLPASTTPGAPVLNGTGKKPGPKLSVRDSLKASIAQLRDQ